MARSLLIRLPGLRFFMPRISTLSRPILPLTLRLAQQPALNALHKSPATGSRYFQKFAARLQASPPPRDQPDASAEGSKQETFGQRLKHLIKSYGWYAIGVYFIIGVLDFSIAFVGINIIGAEHVSRFTQAVKAQLDEYLPSRPAEPGRDEMESMTRTGREGIYAMIVLAYTVHKTIFLPFRVGVTAAVTPRLVRWLRMRGWAGGQGTLRAAREIRQQTRRRLDRD